MSQGPIPEIFSKSNNIAAANAQRSLLLLGFGLISSLWQLALFAVETFVAEPIQSAFKVTYFVSMQYFKTLLDWVYVSPLSVSAQVTIKSAISTILLSPRDWFKIPTTCHDILQDGNPGILVKSLCIMPDTAYDLTAYWFPNNMKNGTFEYAYKWTYVDVLRRVDIMMTTSAVALYSYAGVAIPYNMDKLVALYAIGSVFATKAMESYNSYIVESFVIEVDNCTKHKCSLEKLISLYQEKLPDFYNSVEVTLPETLMRDIVDIAGEFLIRPDPLKPHDMKSFIVNSFIAKQVLRLLIGCYKFVIYNEDAVIATNVLSKGLEQWKAKLSILIAKELNELYIEEFNYQNSNGDTCLWNHFPTHEWAGRCLCSESLNLGLSGNSTIPISEE